jgi:hypothetical protein
MATTPNSVVTPQLIQKVTGTTFVNADSTGAKTLCTAGANGSILTGIAGQTTDTAANNVKILVDGVWIGTLRVAIGAGSDGAIVSKSLLNTTDLPFLLLDSNGNPCLKLGPASVVTVAPLVAVTAAKTLSLQPTIEDY